MEIICVESERTELRVLRVLTQLAIKWSTKKKTHRQKHGQSNRVSNESAMKEVQQLKTKKWICSTNIGTVRTRVCMNAMECELCLYVVTLWCPLVMRRIMIEMAANTAQS
jgi:hypothetical protein